MPQIDYKGLDELVLRYREIFVQPIVANYPEHLRDRDSSIIELAIRTPSGFLACFRIEPPGFITGAWHESEDSFLD